MRPPLTFRYAPLAALEYFFNTRAAEAFFANGIPGQPTRPDSLPFDTDVRLLTSQIPRAYFFLFHCINFHSLSVYID
jgi:hypothetical protein